MCKESSMVRGFDSDLFKKELMLYVRSYDYEWEL
jgi:hypothetical protein